MPTTPNSLMSRYFLAIVAVWRSNTRDHGGLVPAIVTPVCDMKRVGSTAERLEKTPYTQRVCMWENYPGCLPSPDDVHRSTSAQRWRAHQGDISRPEIGANGSLLGPTRARPRIIPCGGESKGHRRWSIAFQLLTDTDCLPAPHALVPTGPCWPCPPRRSCRQSG